MLPPIRNCAHMSHHSYNVRNILHQCSCVFMASHAHILLAIHTHSEDVESILTHFLDGMQYELKLEKPVDGFIPGIIIVNNQEDKRRVVNFLKSGNPYVLPNNRSVSITYTLSKHRRMHTYHCFVSYLLTTIEVT